MICGLAIPHIYEFFALKEGKTVEQTKNSAEVFSSIDTDPISQKAFNHFLRLLGTCISHLAAAMLPDDGIFLCQGILSGVKDKLKEDVSKGEDSIFLKAFTNNKSIESYLKTIPFYLTSESDLGLKGCLNFLKILANNYPSMD